MFSFLFNPSDKADIPQLLYATVIEQSRQTYLFTEFGVPDTVMGRFDMLALHTYLLARRLKFEPEQRASHLAQEVFDQFVWDIERALRELGIGDTAVPKRKKKMVRSFYGQIDDFDGAMDEKNLDALSKASENRYLTESKGDPDRMARYMIEQEAFLLKQPMSMILHGELTWTRASEVS